MDNKAGIGIYNKTTEEKYKFRLNNRSAIMSNEIIAITKAIEIEMQENNTDSDVIIFTDSKSALQLIKKALYEKTNNSLVEELLMLIKNINNNNKIIIQWIPSHVGIKGNEIADQLAKEGTEEEGLINNKLTIAESIKLPDKHPRLRSAYELRTIYD
jgi:ribonuclease HI